MHTAIEYAIGLDLGGTKLLAALIRDDGEIIYQDECETLAEQGEKVVIERIFSLLENVFRHSNINKQQVKGIGIGTAGVIDTEKSEIVYANNLNWNHVPIGQLLTERFDLPVLLNNDANIAAVAEWIWGSSSIVENLIYITVSTGVGCGIISNGQLINGVSDSAGEFGHTSIHIDGPVCVCGNRGCIENYTSGPALARLAKQRLEQGEQSSYFNKVDDYSWITAKHIGEAARSGDLFSIQLFKEIGTYLGAGLTNLIHLLNPEVIVFGGGVMQNSEFILPTIQATVEKRCIPEMRKQVKIRKSVLGSEAGVKGAAGLFLTKNRCSTTVTLGS
jgi:glucokinase